MFLCINWFSIVNLVLESQEWIILLGNKGWISMGIDKICCHKSIFSFVCMCDRQGIKADSEFTFVTIRMSSHPRTINRESCFTYGYCVKGKQLTMTKIDSFPSIIELQNREEDK